MELYLQKFMREHENWEELLSADPYNIKVSRDNGYILFKYNQIASDFNLPEVREARGIIFNEATKECVCHPFDKFGNYGESYCPEIDWSTASVQEKVDGCFSKKDCVMLADGTKKAISEIVNKKLNCEVLSYNQVTGKIEPKRVVGWKRRQNGSSGVRQSDWLTLKLRGVKQSVLAAKQSQHSILTVTKNHMIFVADKNTGSIIEKSAEELTLNDIVYTTVESLSNLEQQVCLGTLLGDGSLTYATYPTRSSGLEFSHSLKQEDYARWKASLLHSFSPKITVSHKVNSYGGTRIRVNSNCSTKFSKIKSLCYGSGYKEVTLNWLNSLDSLGFAIWYMDDGYLNRSAENSSIGLATEGFSEAEVRLIVEFLAAKGLTAYIKHYRGLYGLTLSTVASEAVWLKIRKFIPECMQYKLPERHRGYFDPMAFEPYKVVENAFELVPATIVSIEPGLARKNIDGTAKYDIEVEDNHNYFCGGILVHNSLMKVWYDNDWHVSTNGTIDAANANAGGLNNKTYRDVFEEALPFSFDTFVKILHKGYCYMFELVSPLTRVVIEYPKAKLYLLGVRDMTTHQEYNPEGFSLLRNHFDIPKRYELHSLADVKNAANALPWDEEGYVVCDKQYNRVKIKSPEYVRAHYARNNSVITWERLIDVVLAGEIEEFCIYASDFADKVKMIDLEIHKFMTDVRITLEVLKPESFANRKDYAMEVKKLPQYMQPFLFKYDRLDEAFAELKAAKLEYILRERGVING